MTLSQVYRGLVFSLTCSFPVWAQWSYPGCTDVTATSFSYATIVPAAEIWEPSDLDLTLDATGGVEIYYTELDNNGAGDPRVRRRLANGTYETLANLPIWQGPYGGGQSDTEEGITGIALDPDFKTNHYVYIHWSPASASVFRISRFTVTGSKLTKERIVLDIPAQRQDCCHTGGGMAFDNQGDLWISQGNNRDRTPNGPPDQGIDEGASGPYSSDEGGAANTNALVGGILRIHPTDSGTPTYTKVAGNFVDYFGDATKVRPEVYTKGSRNAYKLAVDPVRRWVAWGDVGPDGPTASGSNVHEEFNLRTTPAFMGWPYFVGKNLAYSFSGSAEDVNAPTNNSKWNTGMTTLPPATEAFYSESQGANTGVAFYQYNPLSKLAGKFPPHFHQKWFYASWSSNQVNVIETNENGTAMVSRKRIFTNASFNGPTAMKFGPDGNLYIANYNGLFTSGAARGIVKVAYTGPDCNPVSIRPYEYNLNPNSRFVQSLQGWVVHLRSGRPILVPKGVVGFSVYDLRGHQIWGIKNLRMGQEFTLPKSLPQGAMKYRWMPTK